MSLLVHTFRVWIESPAGSPEHQVRFLEIQAGCFDSAREEATPELVPGEVIFCIDQITEV